MVKRWRKNTRIICRRGTNWKRKENRKSKRRYYKINRCQPRMSQFQHNRFFRNNDGPFYKQIDGSKEGEEIVIPGAQEGKTYWTDIWGQQIKKDINGKNKQARVKVSWEQLKKILKKILNWKASGPDGVQGFWLKNFTSLHKNHSEWLKEEQYLYKKVNQRKMKQATTTPYDRETVDRDNWWWNLWLCR